MSLAYRKLLEEFANYNLKNAIGFIINKYNLKKSWNKLPIKMMLAVGRRANSRLKEIPSRFLKYDSDWYVVGMKEAYNDMPSVFIYNENHEDWIQYKDGFAVDEFYSWKEVVDFCKAKSENVYLLDRGK